MPGASPDSARRDRAGVVAELDVGDVVTFRRVWHPDEDSVIAVVVGIPRSQLQLSTGLVRWPC